MRQWTLSRTLALALLLALVALHPGVRVAPLGAADAANASAPTPRLPRTNLLLYHDARGGIDTVRSVADWQKRRAEIVRGAEAIMGPLPGKEKRGPLQVREVGEDDCGTFVRRQITFVSEPGGHVSAFLLIPQERPRQGSQEGTRSALPAPAQHAGREGGRRPGRQPR